MNEDRLREACGVFGVYGPGEDVARMTYFGLYALQHRGQESAGIVTADGSRLVGHTRMGLVAQVFNEDALSNLRGHIAIGHARYSTMGSSRICNAQPIVLDGPDGQIALAHNGNLVNFARLRDELASSGRLFHSSSDSEIIGGLFCDSPGDDWLTRIRHSMSELEGAYSLVMLTRNQLIGVRDPLGVRPLCLGKRNNAWIISSESCALDTVGAKFVREVEPGEIVIVDERGLHCEKGRVTEQRALCIFEYIYFARPDSVINDRLVYLARQEMGRRLAREHPADADLVIAVPDSALPAGIGYSQEASIRFAEGLVKNRYIGRTFIQPDQRLREVGINLKFNPLPEVLAGQRVVVVDDSIVRGTTTRPIVRLLRRAGAREVHVRIHCPPMRYPCYLGVDTARRGELIASRMSVPEIRRYIEADSLGFLSLSGLVAATGVPSEALCTGCFTGHYPIPILAGVDKLSLETESETVGEASNVGETASNDLRTGAGIPR